MRNPFDDSEPRVLPGMLIATAVAVLALSLLMYLRW